MTGATLIEKTYAGNAHVRFDDGEVVLEESRCGSLLYAKKTIAMVAIVGLFGLTARATTRYWTGAGSNAKASTAANWLTDKADSTTTGAPIEGDDVIFDATGRNKACTWDLNVALGSWTQDGYTNVVTVQTKFGDTGFTCLTINGNVSLQSGIWKHQSNSASETYRLCVACSGSFVLGADATIDATKAGYAASKGPGLLDNHCGGAYGGQGWSNSSIGLPSPCYGSITKPVNLGTGGYQAGCAGGGAIRLVVTGALTVDGHILSDSGWNVSHWCGSGGSVWITAQSLAGSGRISASGGSVAGMYPSGGGRISVVLTGDAADFTTFTGTIVADPCRTTSSPSNVQPTAAGTVYLETAADGEGHGQLVIDRASSSGTLVTPVTDIILDDQEASFSPKEIVMRNGATVQLTGGTRRSFKIGKRLTMDGQVALKASGVDLDLSECDIVYSGSGSRSVKFFGTENCTLKTKPIEFNSNCSWTFSAPCAFTVSSLKIASGGVMTVDCPLAVSCGVTVEDGGLITHTANTKSSDYRLTMTVDGDMTVKSGGAVSAWAKGLPKKVGLGSGDQDWGAGCHGGHGWSYSGDHRGVGVCYGSVTRPTELGSGGYSWAENGGGAVRLVVTGKLTNDGRIDADGEANAVTSVNYGYRTSPAGSVWITCATLSGAGRIEANAMGTNGLSTAAANAYAAGGRVAVWLTQSGADFSGYTGTTVAYGARGSQYKAAGGAGTVYLKTGDQGETDGTLIVDNATPSGYSCAYTEIGSDVTDAVVGDVIVRNGARLRVLAGSHLTVRGDWKVPSSLFSTEAGGGLVFAGTSTSTIEEDLTTSSFECSEAGKEIVFVAGKTLTISAGGNFLIGGSVEAPVVFESSAENESWLLNVDATAAQSVNRVSVSDCDASSGAEVSAVNSTLTRAKNWKNTIVVYGQTIRWTGGADSSLWLAADNWDAGRAPLSTDRIVIDPSDFTPVVSDDFSILALTVSENASLDLGGHVLTVGGSVINAGRIVSGAVGKIVAAGDVIGAGGTAEPHKIDLELAGDGTAQQLFDSGSCVFNSITVKSNAAGVRIASDVTTSTFSCETDDAFAIEFAPGKTLKVESRLTLAGSDAVLTLRSATAGETWFVDCPGVKLLSGLSVSDSMAKTGTMRARDSTDGGRNAGWDFSGSTAVWTGTASMDFHTAGNWSTGVVPGAGDDVVIGSGTVVADTSVTVSTLRLTDGANVSLNAGVSVEGTLYLESGATLTHSANENDGENKLNVTVGGDLVIENGASVDVSYKGYPTNRGPNWSMDDTGGVYGGRGISTAEYRSENRTYGSILWPTDLGSGGAWVAGGGSAVLVVTGLARVDGSIVSKGDIYNGYYAGSGGSVSLKARELIGAGTLAADGGDYDSNYSGGGGRVAVILTGEGMTFDSFAGAIHAYSGSLRTEIPQVPHGSPGTVYLETAADGVGRGTVTIDNSDSCFTGNMTTRPLVDYPVLKLSPDRKEAKDAKFILKNYVYLNIVTNAVMGDLEVVGSNAKILLNGHKLRIRSYRPADWPKDGSYPSYIVPGEDASGNPGRVVWNQGFSVIVR